jgi:HK97 gp10 family phage protein
MSGDYDFKTTGFQFKGFRELYRAIDHLPEVVQAREIAPVLVKSLTPMRNLARAIAPDDPLTGPPWSLPQSIEVGTKQRSGRARRNRALGKYDSRAYMGPTKGGYPQAIMQEFGTINMVASPYMRPAFEAKKYEALEIIREELGKRLMLIAKKYGPKG